ncbi:MAG: DUF11 domain-containing protein [Holophagales bacterium]|nr:MAG: DUF11 domain-containing protein [Holophagales bacterium]
MGTSSRRLSIVLLLAGLALAPLAAFATPPATFQILEVGPEGLTPSSADGTGKPITATGATLPHAVLGQSFGSEIEPNGTSATATAVAGASAVVLGTVYPAADVDFFSFTAAANDRVYAAVQTLFDASASGDSVLDLIATDGSTVLENDPNDGTFNGSSSSIAGTPIPAAGTYFLRVRHNLATGTIRPYQLQFRLQSGAPAAEVEPNNTTATATPLPASGWASGTVTAVSPGEADFFSLTLAAGDSVYLSLDMNPERDASVWNGRLGFGLFGNPPANQILVANDANAGATSTDPNSEALFLTVKDAGTYYIYVDSTVAAGLGASATYHLSVSVRPHVDATASCTTYTSTNVPQTIPTGPGSVSSTITVPGNLRIADLDVSINLNHTFMQDLDAHLVSPAGNDNGLFTDIGSATTGGTQTLMDLRFDDEAALPPAFALSAGMVLQPELAYRLAWFDGEDAGGTWTLTLRDDATGDGGTLNAWSLTICEPPPPPACAPGFTPTTVYSSDFETNDGGFTHSGAIDEWERGLPAFAPITSCASGSNCWKTDLDNTYNTGVAAGSPADLLSPAINLAGLSAPVTVRWSQRFQIESASFDRAFIDFQQVGGATPVRLWEWLDATMTSAVGNPTTTIQESSGWSAMSARADSLAGLNTELHFNLTADNTVQLAGLAIDDVTVTACRALSADLSITKTDGVTTAIPGTNVTYTITASNAGTDPVTGATVTDTFSAFHAGCTWTCAGAGGGTCTAAGSGNISDTVNLPVGGSVTYAATCGITYGATGSLVNTATVSSSVTDPNPANNSATDTDTLTPQADLTITKTDGVTTATPGGSVTYTIVATNAGPSNAVSSTVADTFPATLTCNWTCTGAGGTCTAAGSGNINDSVNLPAGASVTYTAACAISASATGSLSNTATVTSATPDPTPGNNSATDSDTLSPQADLSITKTDGLTNANLGQSSAYAIVVSNAGPSNAPGTLVSDTFPAGFASPTWTCVGAGGGTCTANGVGNINDTVNLPAGGSVTYTASGTIAGSPGTLSNTATVAAAGGVTDPTPGNNSATDTTTVAGGAAVTGTKSASGTFGQATTVTYTIVLTNAGAGSQNDNPGDELTDVLPATLTLVSASATSGTALANIGTNTVTWNGAIPAAGSVTITITATVNTGTLGQTISNQGTISYDSDGNGSNDASASTDDPAVAGGADPTVFVVGGSVLEIPTLSGLGLAALAFVLAALALVALRRRSA